MSRSRRHRAGRLSWGGILIAGVLALAVGGVAAAALASRPEIPDPGAYTPKPMETEAPLPTVPVAAGTRVVFLGDSWTAGYGATNPDAEGFAHVVSDTLQYTSSFDDVSGTGYTNEGPSGQDSYLSRLARLPADPNVQLLIIQGSGNDAGQDQTALRQRARATVAQARTTYPNAVIVVIGPAPLRFPLKGDIPLMDASLFAVARAQGAHYISPYTAGWFTAENAAQLIDPDKLYHPNTEGHKYFGGQVVEELEKMSSVS